MFQANFPLWFRYVCAPSRLDTKGSWIIGMKWQVEDDIVKVDVLLCGWAVICLCTGNCFVEQALNFVAFVAMDNQMFEKNLCSLYFVSFRRAEGKNSKQGAVHNPWE